MILKAYRQVAENSLGFNVFPFECRAGGLLPWAVGGGGQLLFFVMIGTSDLCQTMIMASRSSDCEMKYCGSPAILLYQYMKGTLRSLILPSLEFT